MRKYLTISNLRNRGSHSIMGRKSPSRDMKQQSQGVSSQGAGGTGTGAQLHFHSASDPSPWERSITIHGFPTSVRSLWKHPLLGDSKSHQAGNKDLPSRGRGAFLELCYWQRGVLHSLLQNLNVKPMLAYALSLNNCGYLFLIYD